MIFGVALLGNHSTAQPLWQPLPDGIWGWILEAPDGRLVAGRDSMIYRSTDNGESWIVSAHATGSYAVGVDSTGALYSIRYRTELFPGTDDEYTITSLYRSADDGTTWQLVGDGIGMPAFDLSRPDILAAGFRRRGPMGGIRGGGVQVSTDGGRSWRATSLQLATDHVAVTARGTLLAAVSEIEEAESVMQLHASRDAGATWEILFDSLETSILAVAPNGTIYLAGATLLFDPALGFRVMRPVFMRSIDDGLSWEEIDFDDDGINSLYLTPSSEVYLKTRDMSRKEDVFYSNDNGQSWKSLSPTPGGSLPDFLGTLGNGDIVVRGDSTLYRSSDDGTTWSSIQFDLPHSLWWSLLATRSGYLFAGAGGRLHRLSLATLGAE